MKMLTIMPDFGNGPYAWIKDADDDTCWVGGCTADALSGFEFSDYKVSAALEADFAAWMTWFGREALGDAALSMDWNSFHEQGFALAKRLKAELGDQVRVVYDKPVEDPAYKLRAPTQVRMEVLSDGTLKPITLRRVGPKE